MFSLNIFSLFTDKRLRKHAAKCSISDLLSLSILFYKYPVTIGRLLPRSMHLGLKFALQNHRIIYAGRDLLRLPSPTSQLKHSLVQQVAQDRVQLVFTYLHRHRIRNLSAKPVPVLDHLHIKKKKNFLLSDGISCGLTCIHCLLSFH